MTRDSIDHEALALLIAIPLTAAIAVAVGWHRYQEFAEERELRQWIADKDARDEVRAGMAKFQVRTGHAPTGKTMGALLEELNSEKCVDRKAVLYVPERPDRFVMSGPMKERQFDERWIVESSTMIR